MSRHILALDQGTTSSRAILFDRAGSILAVAQREFRQVYPRPGWVEHDAEEIWETQAAVAREALASAGVGAADVAAIGITNQRETTVVWERRTGRPIHRAIVWQDRRTADRCERLSAEGLLPLIRETTGLVLDPYFSATKFEWLLRTTLPTPTTDLALGTVDKKIYGVPFNASNPIVYFNADLVKKAGGDPEKFPSTFEEIIALATKIKTSLLEALERDDVVGGVADVLSGVGGDHVFVLRLRHCPGPGAPSAPLGVGRTSRHLV